MKKLFVTAAIVALASFGAAADAAFTWTPGQAVLKAGSPYSMQVVELQKCLAELGNNPAYNVDGLYGPVTASAVRSFQANYNLTNPGSPILVDGIIGNQTGPLYVAACADAMDDAGDDEGDDDSDSDNDGELSGGEASLEDYDMASEDDAQEGESMQVATVEFDVEDGDVELNRVDLSFVSGSATNEEDEPWDVFETITLMVDGDEIAEESVDDEDDWLSEDEPFVFRFSGLDYVARDGETVEIEIWVTAQNNVDGADTNGNAVWDIAVAEDGIRAVDSEGIQNYTGDENLTYAANGYTAGDFVTFDVEEEGGDESIEIGSSSDDPDASVLRVETDDESDWYEAFIFELESEESDIDIDEIVLTADLGTDNYNDVVSEVKLEIDGQEFDDVTVTGDKAVNGGVATLTFDIDGAATIDADETVDVVVMVQFKQTDGNYADDETIQFATVSVDGEGADDVTDAAVVTGETHTLLSAGIMVEVTEASAEVTAQDGFTDAVQFVFEVDVTAFEENVYINKDLADVVTASTADDVDVLYTVEKSTTSVAQENEVTVGAVANATLYTVTLNGTDFDYTSDGDATVQEIVEGLAAAINGGAEPVTASEDDVTLTLTADVAGTGFTIAVTANLDNTATVANAGSPLLSVSGTIVSTSGAVTVNGDDDAYTAAYLNETFFRVNKGDTETFRITISGANQTDSKQVRALLDGIEWTTDVVNATDQDATGETINSYTSELGEDAATPFVTVS